jgi:hypothetical protein
MVAALLLANIAPAQRQITEIRASERAWLTQSGVLATLRFLFAKIWVGECYRDFSTTTKFRETGTPQRR